MNQELNNLVDLFFSKHLLNRQDSLIVTGSFAVCSILSSDFSRFHNGKSDIDAFIVFEDNKSIDNIITDKRVKNALEEGVIDLVNYSFTYGVGRNRLNIKYIPKRLFDDLSSFQLIKYNSSRQIPLTSFKKCEIFKCSDGTSDIYQYVENYNSKYDCYILSFNYQPIQNNIYRFSNIHSMLVNGILAWDGCNIQKQYIKFWDNFSDIFPTTILEAYSLLTRSRCLSILKINVLTSQCTKDILTISKKSVILH